MKKLVALLLALMLGLGAFAALVAGAVHGMIDNSFFLPDLAVLFWTFLVLLSIAPDSTASSEVAA